MDGVQAGLEASHFRHGLGAIFTDVNGDGRPDLYVANDEDPNDPALKRQYEGPKAGTGAVYAWQGNKDVGEGRMTITESKPAELVRIVPKLPGRNDPCLCGSTRKYKKCCGAHAAP